MYFYFPLDGILVHFRVTPGSEFAGTHLYTWVERGKNTSQCPWPGLEPGLLDPETSALTMRPLHLPGQEIHLGIIMSEPLFRFV